MWFTWSNSSSGSGAVVVMNLDLDVLMLAAYDADTTRRMKINFACIIWMDVISRLTMVSERWQMTNCQFLLTGTASSLIVFISKEFKLTAEAEEHENTLQGQDRPSYRITWDLIVLLFLPPTNFSVIWREKNGEIKQMWSLSRACSQRQSWIGVGRSRSELPPRSISI